MKTNKLQNKVAIVTGASKGIGASIAKNLAAEGASVVVNYSSSKEGADRVVAEIVGQGGSAVAVKANVAHQADIAHLIAETTKTYGPIDILVNNAGVFQFAPIEQVTEASFHHQFNTNVLGLLLTTQEAIKAFNPAGGSIINISSTVSRALMPGSSVYSATKASVDAITVILARELGARKIRVNAINPGMVITEGVEAAGISEGDFRKNFEAAAPLGRVGVPQDIASAAVFLASEDSSWITGELLFVTGGYRS